MCVEGGWEEDGKREYTKLINKKGVNWRKSDRKIYVIQLANTLTGLPWCTMSDIRECEIRILSILEIKIDRPVSATDYDDSGVKRLWPNKDGESLLLKTSFMEAI